MKIYFKKCIRNTLDGKQIIPWVTVGHYFILIQNKNHEWRIVDNSGLYFPTSRSRFEP